jgi:hypothetical protein
MLIRHETWDQIRDQFSEEEKMDLRECVTGECICPPGLIIEESDLLPERLEQLQRAMASAGRTRGAKR